MEQIKYGGYAYIGGGVVHVVSDKETALKHSDNDKVIWYPGPHLHGYPVACSDDHITIYQDGSKEFKDKHYPKGTWPAGNSLTRKLLKELL